LRFYPAEEKWTSRRNHESKTTRTATCPKS
jgi:hypothetical protein